VLDYTLFVRLTMTSSFFQHVYHAVRMIPPGRVATYGQVATYLGNPHAARTVGWALHALSEGTDVPWHRVVNAKGRISIDHGASQQRAMLEEEGVVFDEGGRIDLKRFRWEGPR
jgi:methylated-DNA-protein-cysteine methyltransferase-like protein